MCLFLPFKVGRLTDFLWLNLVGSLIDIYLELDLVGGRSSRPTLSLLASSTVFFENTLFEFTANIFELNFVLA